LTWRPFSADCAKPNIYSKINDYMVNYKQEYEGINDYGEKSEQFFIRFRYV
jgi:hypothetical protein